MPTETARCSPEVTISLKRVPSDPPQFSDQYQQALVKLIQELKAVGVNATPYFDMQGASGLSCGLGGDFTLLLGTGPR